VSKVMRVKLDHTQKILEAVVTSNWQQLEAESRALARVTQGPDWYVLKMPEYARYSEAFVRATDELIEAASQRDLEATSLGFASLTARCIACHRSLARGRIASARPSP
jgi:mono/diheme cytochrome c family protein